MKNKISLILINLMFSLFIFSSICFAQTRQDNANNHTVSVEIINIKDGISSIEAKPIIYTINKRESEISMSNGSNESKVRITVDCLTLDRETNAIQLNSNVIYSFIESFDSSLNRPVIVQGDTTLSRTVQINEPVYALLPLYRVNSEDTHVFNQFVIVRFILLN